MMDVTIHQLQCFDAVVTEGSFQAAAEIMRRAQPSVSLAVRNLEAQLGLSLLDRSGYRVSLTEAGRSFHARGSSCMNCAHSRPTRPSSPWARRASCAS